MYIFSSSFRTWRYMKKIQTYFFWMKSRALRQAHLEKLKKLFSNLEGGKSGFITFKMLEETWPQVCIYLMIYIYVYFLFVWPGWIYLIFFKICVKLSEFRKRITCFFFTRPICSVSTCFTSFSKDNDGLETNPQGFNQVLGEDVWSSFSGRNKN